MKGKQLQWVDIEKVGVVTSMIESSDPSINVSCQKKADSHIQLRNKFLTLISFRQNLFTKLLDVNKVKQSNLRPGRTVAKRGQKSLALYWKLKRYMQILQSSNLSGSPSAKIVMRCAVSLLNKTIKPSHFYNGMCNPSYSILKPSHFLTTTMA